jgi:hypothetical protein
MGKRRMRKRYEASFKAWVALAALKDDKTMSELASEFGVHGNLISQWKRRRLSNVPGVLDTTIRVRLSQSWLTWNLGGSFEKLPVASLS